MKVLKALLAILTTLAVVLTGLLLFQQEKSAAGYIRMPLDEQ